MGRYVHDARSDSEKYAACVYQAQRDHLWRTPWISPEKCWHRDPDSKHDKPWIKCARRDCPNLCGAGGCGSYCSKCFPRILSRSGGPPEVVVLCGSTKFPEAFATASKRLGLEGKIVLSVSMFGHAGDLTEEECTIGHPTKDALDLLHKQKIDMADRVLVLNVGGYIGDSTRSEIEYAEWFAKPIDYLELI